MYQLYYYPGNANVAPHLLLEELGVDFELVLVDRKSEAQKSPAYLKLNPAGRIPTLVDGDLVLFESPAICVYLAEQNPKSALIPLLGHRDRPIFFQWMMYLTNTLQAELMVYFYPEKHTEDASGSAAIAAAQETRITEMFRLLDHELEGKVYLVGNHLTACDFYLFMLANWGRKFTTPPLSFRHLGRYLRALSTRTSVQKVCQKEGIDLKDYASSAKLL
ncbi:MAG: glutathione S-transferase family protein [Kordiimonadaceae bacterium]|nr:glutathione S-transferase family protein [Kordiimonadaceae bacterium]